MHDEEFGSFLSEKSLVEQITRRTLPAHRYVCWVRHSLLRVEPTQHKKLNSRHDLQCLPGFHHCLAVSVHLVTFPVLTRDAIERDPSCRIFPTSHHDPFLLYVSIKGQKCIALHLLLRVRNDGNDS